MLELLNGVLAGGLAAVAAPIIIHLMHRRKVHRVDWGAMRFLYEMLAKSRRRLIVDELLLLLLRVLVVAALALALTRPALKRGPLFRQDVLLRYGRTAAVLLVDDSLSSGLGRTQTALDEVKRLALAYLDTLAPGDEVSVLALSQLQGPAGEPLFDLQAAKAMVGQLRPTAVASDIPALLEAGLVQLGRHINPGAELALAYDGRRDGWHTEERTRWEELRQRLRGPPDATPGSRQRPHLLILNPPTGPAENNLAITGIRLDRTLVSARRPVGIQAEVSHFGAVAPPPVTVRFFVNGKPIGDKTVSVPARGKRVVGLAHTFEEPGSCAVEARLAGVADSLPADDQRALAVQVENAVPVLLVEGRGPAGLQGSLGFLAAALDPEGQGAGAFQLTRVPVAQLNERLVQRHRVVVLGDVPALSAEMIDTLEQHVVGGGGILVGLGAQTDAALVNRLWARGGTGFLPSPLGAVQKPTQPRGIGSLNAGHPVFNAFGFAPGEAWKEGRVRRYYALELSQVARGEVDTLMSLDNGDPLLVQRRRGVGLVALVTTSLDGQWNELPLLPAYVPWLRGVVGHLGSFVMPPRNLLPGDRLTFALAATNQPATGEGPGGRPFRLTPGVWEGRPAVISDPLLEPGAYTVRQGRLAVRHAVATVPAESELALQPAADVQSCLTGLGHHPLHTPEQIDQTLLAAPRRSVEIWRWLLGGCLVALFLETFLTRREAKAVGTPLVMAPRGSGHSPR